MERKVVGVRPRSIPQIFVSYSRRDAEFMKLLIRRLKQELGDELAIWYDADISPGENWWERVRKQIKRSSTFLVILSSNSLNKRKSKYVRMEIDIAWQRHAEEKIEIVPIQYGSCRIPDDLKTLNVVSFLSEEGFEESFQRLLYHFRSFVEQRALVKELNEVELSSLQNMIDQVHRAFKEQNWVVTIRSANSLIEQYPKVVPCSIYVTRGLAYLYADLIDRDQLGLAEGSIKQALGYELLSPQKLDLLDIYVGILISQKRWNEIRPHLTTALQLLPPLVDQVKFTANDERVWLALQEEVSRWEVKKENQVVTSTLKVVDEEVRIDHKSESNSISDQMQNRASKDEVLKSAHVFKLDISWSWRHLQVFIQKTPSTSKMDGVS